MGRNDDDFDDDDFGQVDGDTSGPVRFQSRLGAVGTPWLRNGLPPWHMWGTTENVTAIAGAAFTPRTSTEQQISKVAYRRPETWHWLFHAELLEPLVAAPAGQSMNLEVTFQLTVGLGRSSVFLPAFETLSWTWSDGALPPTEQALQRWSTQALTQARRFTSGGAPVTQPDNLIDQIVAQDIQCKAQVRNGSTVPSTMSCRVSAFFAPKNHLRPEWFLGQAPLETRFGGNETGGT